MRKDGMHLNRKLRLYLGTAEFYKRVGIIAIPIALQSLISIGVNMMDTVMLGALGEVALSASSLANQFINIYHVCCMGIGMGGFGYGSQVLGNAGFLFSEAVHYHHASIMHCFRSAVYGGYDSGSGGADAYIYAGCGYYQGRDPVFQLVGAHLSFTGIITYLHDCTQKCGAG